MNFAKQRSFNPTRVQDWIANECTAERLKSGVLEIQWAGETVHSQAFGSRNSDEAPVTSETQFWVASMTKPIVSFAAMRLIERGSLSLCDPVSKFISGFGTNGVLLPSGEIAPVERPPTVLDLLIHTSGVTYGFLGEDDIHQRYREAAVYDFHIDNKEMAERLSLLPLMHQPGHVFEYGMSTDLLGRVIEVVTRLQLDDALDELIFAPLNMNASSFLPDPGNVAQLAPSPVRDTIAPLLSPEQSWWSGGAGLWTSVSDYMRFAQMLLCGGSLDGTRLLKPEALALMCRNHLPKTVSFGNYTETLGIAAPWQANGLGFGLGFAVRTARSRQIPGGLSEFFWPGVSGANFWVDPENDLIAVFLTFSPEHRTTHRIELREAVYAGLKKDQTL